MESQIKNANSKEYQLGVLSNIENNMSTDMRDSLYNWSIVKEYLLQHTRQGGRTSAYKHCEFLGINPDGRRIFS